MNPDSADSTSLRDYLGVLKARRGTIAAVTLIAVALGLAYSLVKTPTYEAEATIEFSDPAADLPIATPGAQGPVDFTPDKSAAADSRIVTRDDVVRRVERQIGDDVDATDIEDHVDAAVQPDSNLVAITGTSESADDAALIANAFAQQTRNAARQEARDRFAAKADELDAAIGPGLDPVTRAQYQSTIAKYETLAAVADPVEITRPATVPGSPASPKPIRDTILAAILGLLIGIGVAFLRNALDRRIKDSHEIQHELGLPLVGYVRSDALGLAGVGRNGASFVSEDDLEAFRILRTNVDFLAGDDAINSLVVTSALPEEGKSTVAAWYAYVNAVAGRSTLLVECDFRRPVLAKRFGVAPGPGLSDYLAGNVRPKEVLRSVSTQGREGENVLALIPAGENAFQPTEMIASKTFKSFVAQVTKTYDMVIFDSAPLLPVGDTLELMPQVDAALFCVRLGQTTRDQALAAKQAMSHLPERPTGLVVTGVKRGGDDDYYGYYSYSPQRAESVRAG
jgi:capsular exopolysaccharide synthesis family protein